MNEQTCASCGRAFPSGAMVCPFCGHVAPAPTVPPVVPGPAGPAVPDAAAASAPGGYAAMPTSSQPAPPPPIPPPPPQPAAAGGWAGPPAMAGGWQPPPSAPKRTAIGVFAIVGSIVIAVIVAAVIMSSLDSGPSLPDAINGVPRDETSQAKAIEDGLQKAVDEAGGSGQAALYGDGPTPTYMLAFYSEGVSTAFDVEFDSFTNGFAGGAGLTMDETSVVSGTDGGVEFRCESVTERETTLCVWGGPLDFGGFIDFTSGDVNGALALAKTLAVKD